MLCNSSTANVFVLQSSRRSARSGSNARRRKRTSGRAAKIARARLKCLLTDKILQVVHHQVINKRAPRARTSFHHSTIATSKAHVKYQLDIKDKALLRLAVFNSSRTIPATIPAFSTLVTQHRLMVLRTTICTVSAAFIIVTSSATAANNFHR